MEEQISILSQLPEEVRKILVDAKSRIAAERERSHDSTSRGRAGNEEGLEKEGREGREGDRVLRRRKPFYVDIPPHAAHVSTPLSSLLHFIIFDPEMASLLSLS